MSRISGLVVAHNEAHQLAECLKSLAFCDEIIVVLDKCTDDSKAVAKPHATRIIEGSWPIEGERRNLGIESCAFPWVLELDADERVSPELADEIRTSIQISTADFHPVPIDNYVGERLVRYGWGGHFGTSNDIALFRKGHKVYGPQEVHPSVTLTGVKGPKLGGVIEHYVDKDLSDMIRRFDRYTTAHARDLVARGKSLSLAGDVRRIFTRFFKCYVMRKGYKEGGMGLIIGILAGLYPLFGHLKAKYDVKTVKKGKNDQKI